MLSERVKVWEQRWLEQGKLEGIEQGLERGLEKGRQEGWQEAQTALALNLINNTAMDDAMIAKVTGLTVATLQALRAKRGDSL